MAIDKKFLDFQNYVNANKTARNTKKIAEELKRGREELENMRISRSAEMAFTERSAAAEAAAERAAQYKLDTRIREMDFKLKQDAYRAKKLAEHKNALEDPIYALAYSKAIDELKANGDEWQNHEDAAKTAKKISEEAAKEAYELSRARRAKQLNISPGDGKLRSALDTALLKLDADSKSKPTDV